MVIGSTATNSNGLAGHPITAQTHEGGDAVVLIDVPTAPTGPVIPVLVPAVAGKPKEDMGGFAQALVSTGRFAVVRPPFVNSGDEAAGTLEKVAMLPEEIVHWGRWIRSSEFRRLLRERFGIEDLSQKSACCAASLGATLAVHAQADASLFDAMVLFSYVPDYREFVPRKLHFSYEELVARTWRYRFKDSPAHAAFSADIARALADQADCKPGRDKWQLLAEHLSKPEAASRSDFAVTLDGIPMNAFYGFSLALRGVWDFQFDLNHNLKKSHQVDIPLTFFIGQRDDFFDLETMDKYLVAARSSGRIRRAVRLEDADHRMKPLPAFERAMEAAIRCLATDLDETIEYDGISIAATAMRRFQEVRGLASRHAATMGIPEVLMQKFMLPRADMTETLRVLLSRPHEVAKFIELLHADFETRADEQTILDDLQPTRLAKIFDAAMEPELYEPIAAGIAQAADKAHVLFSKAFVETVSLVHLDGVFRALAESGDNLISIIQRVEPGVLDLLGRRRATAQARRACEAVPAYRSLMGQAPGSDGERDLEDFPLTSKATYIEKYSIESRCNNGTLPQGGLIEESSGSSGTATDWVRCEQEDAYMVGATRLFFHYLFKPEREAKPLVLISAFSQGTWASSSRLTVLGRHAGMVKDIGTDIPKIIETINRMGDGYHYVIAGYPPFLRELFMAEGAGAAFRWKDYHIDVYHGGEGYSAGWRALVTNTLAENARVISGYGASDLEVSMAFETRAALAIRERLESDAEFRLSMLGTAHMPVFVGQYNPIDTYLEEHTDAHGRKTIVATVNNPFSWQPRVRYMIGDEGGIIDYPSAEALAQNAGIPVDWKMELNLPFVYLFGRADGTISLDGANVYPNQVQEALYDCEEIGPMVRSFQMQRVEDETGRVEFRVLLETFNPLQDAKETQIAQNRASDVIQEHLCSNNADFREAMTHNETLRPKVKVVSPGTLGVARRIKHQYIGNQ